MTPGADPTELSLVAWFSPFPVGFALPLFGRQRIANTLYLAVGSIPGDHKAKIAGFEQTHIQPTEWLPASKIVEVRAGSPWIDVFRTGDDVLVGRSEELWIALGESGRRKVGRVAPLSLYDLANSAERPERARFAKKALQFVKSRFDEARASEWKLGLVRSKFQVYAYRQLAKAGAPNGVRRPLELISFRLNSFGEPEIDIRGAPAMSFDTDEWLASSLAETSLFAKEFGAPTRTRRPGVERDRSIPVNKGALDEWESQPLAQLAQHLAAKELLKEVSASSVKSDWFQLLRRRGIDPSRDLRFGNFSTCSFNGQNLRGFVFIGCNLIGSTFDGARIEEANFDCARVELAALAKAADFDAYLKWELTRAPKDRFPLDPSRLRDLAVFREAPFAPEMVVMPAGEFMMGSDVGDDELGEDDRAWKNEIVPGQGKRRTRISRRFAIGRYPVTFEEYEIFCEADRRKIPNDLEWGKGRRPVINVSWDDAQAYVAWLNGTLGGAAYRLPSEAEWEYACRAGTETRRWWGDSWDPARANGAMSFEGGRTSPVGHFPANPWGLHDMIGNVWEWCADEWVENVAKLPEEGVPFVFQKQRPQMRPIKTKKKSNNEALRALRGGSWVDLPRSLRAAFRYGDEPDDRGSVVGFRLSRTL